jgi:hypothetical protein
MDTAASAGGGDVKQTFRQRPPAAAFKNLSRGGALARVF